VVEALRDAGKAHGPDTVASVPAALTATGSSLEGQEGIPTDRVEAAGDAKSVPLRFDTLMTVATAGELGDEVPVPVVKPCLWAVGATVLAARSSREGRARRATVLLVEGRGCVVAWPRGHRGRLAPGDAAGRRPGVGARRHAGVGACGVTPMLPFFVLRALVTSPRDSRRITHGSKGGAVR
jgi:hypothetical protein